MVGRMIGLCGGVINGFKFSFAFCGVCGCFVFVFICVFVFVFMMVKFCINLIMHLDIDNSLLV